MPSSLNPQVDEHKWTGFYRGKVTEVDIDIDKGKNAYGCVKVYVPDLHLDDDKQSVKAFPACFPLGGYNSEDKDNTSAYQASVWIPAKNSWVWLFFEGGDTAQGYYFGAFHNKNSMLPPENRDLDEPHKAITIVKSNAGRAIVVCDSKDQARVEITGKKRQIKSPPEGDKDSVYNIDGNMTTVLLDERDGKEKLLIRTHKGDYVNLNIEKRQLHIKMNSDIRIDTDESIHIHAGKDIKVKACGDAYLTSMRNLYLYSLINVFITGMVSVHIRAVALAVMDAALAFVNSGLAMFGRKADPKKPKGDR